MRAHLAADPNRVRACSEGIRVIKVNRRTLTLFEANDLNQLVANLGRVFRDDMFKTIVEELAQLWEGRGEFSSHAVNYTLVRPTPRNPAQGHRAAGPRGTTGSRVLVASRTSPSGKSPGAALALSEQYARGLFEHSPVSLWVEDFSGIKRLMDEMRVPRHQRFPRIHRRASGVRRSAA